MHESDASVQCAESKTQPGQLLRGPRKQLYFYWSTHFKLLYYSAAARFLSRVILPLSPAKPVLLIFDHMLVEHFLPQNSTYMTNAGSYNNYNKTEKSPHSQTESQRAPLAEAVRFLTFAPSGTGKWHMLLFTPQQKRREHTYIHA